MFEGGNRGSRAILTGTLKVAGATAALGYGLAIWLSAGGLEQGRLGRVIADLRSPSDPETTGSLGRLDRTRLDPCVVQRR